MDYADQNNFKIKDCQCANLWGFLKLTFPQSLCQCPPPLSFLFFVVLLCFPPFLSLFLKFFAILSLELASTIAKFSCDHQSCDRNSVLWSMFDIFLPIAGNWVSGDLKVGGQCIHVGVEGPWTCVWLWCPLNCLSIFLVLLFFLRLGFAFFMLLLIAAMSSDLKTLIEGHLQAELNCKWEVIPST